MVDDSTTGDDGRMNGKCSPRKKLKDAQSMDRELSGELDISVEAKDDEPNIIFEQRSVSGKPSLTPDDLRRLHISMPSNKASEHPKLARQTSAHYVDDLIREASLAHMSAAGTSVLGGGDV
ncbi:hypothetical protein Ae201684P_006615 [Aphanomyces euteiches]|uniref:Uncharacterized protein n=1 Tax=Aphanomyces euteiches TaxID=100861 RepID=A0A6G0XC60_9STRA|nr:hypothetical protein Ae201684_006375 [Aphanomyces euteiches]KAH9091215.1 hypothetical protein Ae201684P_006615 [Aphanomyces euteiches]KAH9149787.1 hypothetical protein AeRB84_007258 [Aphanomyces euteiches]